MYFFFSLGPVLSNLFILFFFYRKALTSQIQNIILKSIKKISPKYLEVTMKLKYLCLMRDYLFYMK